MNPKWKEALMLWSRVELQTWHYKWLGISYRLAQDYFPAQCTGSSGSPCQWVSILH